MIPVDQLRGDIGATGGLGFGWQNGIILPIPAGAVGIGCRRGGVGDARGGNDAGGAALIGGPLEQAFNW